MSKLRIRIGELEIDFKGTTVSSFPLLQTAIDLEGWGE
jgi:hypothetical protein